jgi:hypothetical protein
MAWRSGGSTNTELVNNLFRNGLIREEKVRDAMLNVFSQSSFPFAFSVPSATVLRFSMNESYYFIEYYNI